MHRVRGTLPERMLAAIDAPTRVLPWGRRDPHRTRIAYRARLAVLLRLREALV